MFFRAWRYGAAPSFETPRTKDLFVCCFSARAAPQDEAEHRPAAVFRFISYRYALVPLRELDGHPFRAVDEHQLSRVEIHDLVPGLEPARSEPGHFSLDVPDRKTDVVHPQFGEVANVRVGQRLGVPIVQELDFRSW